MSESIINLERDLHVELEALEETEPRPSRMDMAKGVSIPGWDRQRARVQASRELMRRSVRLEGFKRRSRALVKLWEERAGGLAGGHWPPRLVRLERELAIHLGFLAVVLDLVHPGLARDFRRDLHSRLVRAPWSVTLRAASISACGPDSSCREWIALGRSLARDADLLMPASSLKSSEDVQIRTWMLTWGLEGALQQVVTLETFESLSRDLEGLTGSGQPNNSDLSKLRASGWFENGRRTVDRWFDLCEKNPRWFCDADDPRGEAPGRKPGSWRPTRSRTPSR